MKDEHSVWEAHCQWGKKMYIWIFAPRVMNILSPNNLAMEKNGYILKNIYFLEDCYGCCVIGG